MSAPLRETEIKVALAKLPGWTFDDDTIYKTYRLTSFTESIGFITEMAFCCEKANHHPELSNIYSTVAVSLRTHDAGNKVTQKDVDLAVEIEKIAQKRDCFKPI